MSIPSTIAIDGPVASGKSTVGVRLARRLGYRYVDTGTMYRALALVAVRLGIDLEDEGELERLARETSIDVTADSKVLVNGRDVSAGLTRREVEAAVSLVARAAGVRQVLVAQQRQMAQGGSVVMVGRDIGTTVMPDAELKVYLGASPQERARRRYSEVVKRGEAAHLPDILADLERRDRIDSERLISPLQPAADAVVIDTDGLTIEQVIAQIMGIMGEGP